MLKFFDENLWKAKALTKALGECKYVTISMFMKRDGINF
jgi:hypothetical protein